MADPGCGPGVDLNWPILLFLLATSTVLGAADVAKETPLRAAVSGELRHDFPYTPPKAPPAPSPAATDEDVVAMAPVLVFGGPRGATQAIDEAASRARRGAFTLRDGGTLLKLGDLELKIKYDPVHHGFDLLSLSW